MDKNFNYIPLIRYANYVYELNPNVNLVNQIKNTFLFDWDLKINPSAKVLFFQSLDREDYNNFSELIFSTIDDKTKKHTFIKKKKKKNFNALLYNLPKYFELYKSLKYIKNKKKRFFIFFYLIDLLKLLYQLKSLKPKIVITHADMQAIENIIVQFFKNKNIQTITLQHGLYIDYSKEPNINEVNYTNVVSNYFLAWGEETRNLIQKYHPSCKVKTLGNPTIIQKEIHPMDYFVVVFEHEGNKKYNFILLDIARDISKKLKLPIKIKLHPRNIFKEYDINREEVIKHDEVYNAKFAIGHTSTMLYQLLRNDIPIFKLKSNSPCNKTEQKFIFSNKTDLLLKIKNPANINHEKEGEFYIKYTQKEAINKYHDFFNKILSKA
ncbi:hypothetical protein [Arcobacter sp.]|uniref:hypothetical protein n=1 Tax=Arcobacter sp. TaxID=1872629 RepID=UPI003C74457E